MELTSLVTALVIGLVVGGVGWFLLPDGRLRSVWLAIVVGVVSAAIGTSLARALGVARSPGVNWLELAFALGAAAAGVAGLTRVIRQRSVGSGSRRTR